MSCSGEEEGGVAVEGTGETGGVDGEGEESVPLGAWEVGGNLEEGVSVLSFFGCLSPSGLPGAASLLLLGVPTAGGTTTESLVVLVRLNFSKTKLGSWFFRR